MALFSHACCCCLGLLQLAAALDIRTQPKWHPQLAWTSDSVKQVVSLRDLPPPNPADRSVAAGKAHHQEALRRAAAIERAAGHLRPAPPPLPTARVPTANGQRVNPVMYGADPTGKLDSSKAFAQAMAAILNASAHGGKSMAVNIVDLGGATLDLGGGEFLLSEPVMIPQFFGNLHFSDGTLRAHPSFPKDKWLVMIGDDVCKPKTAMGTDDGQDSCNELITFTDMVFDASHVAAGGLNIAHVMGATVSNAFFIGFKKAGINVTGGHEVMISESWLAECYWSQFAPLMPTDPCSPEWNSESVGIQIHGPDNSLVNVIVFGFARVGVEVFGHCNLLYGVHTWNSVPLPLSFKPGVGISLGGPNSPFNDHNDNRVIGSYLDFNTLDMYDPSHTVVEGNMFLGTYANLYPLSRTDKWGDAEIDGLVMHGNTYTTDKSAVLGGTFKKLTNVVISDEINAAKSTRVRMELTQKSSTRWEFDFSKVLVFPNIEQVQYSVISNSPTFFQHLARLPEGAKVVVETSVAVDATVVVDAVQGLGGSSTTAHIIVEL